MVGQTQFESYACSLHLNLPGAHGSRRLPKNLKFQSFGRKNVFFLQQCGFKFGWKHGRGKLPFGQGVSPFGRKSSPVRLHGIVSEE